MSDWIGGLIEESLDQYWRNWALMAAAAPAGEVFESNALHYAIAGTSIALFNAAFVRRPLAAMDELEAAATEASAEFRRRKIPGVLTGPTSWLPAGTQDRLETLRFRRVHSFMGMRTARLNEPERPPREIDLREIDGDAAVEPMARINGAAYGMDRESWQQLLLPNFWRRPVRAYGAYEGGDPVAVGGVATAQNVCYVMWMATLPQARNRGYAEAIIRRAWEDSRQQDGAKVTALHATEMGRPVYGRLGYVAIAEFPAFGWQPPAAEL